MARYSKSEINGMIKQAFELKEKCIGVDVVFDIYSNGLYVLDTEEDNLIDSVKTEDEAKEICESPELKGSCFYKPKLIDAIDGQPIKRTNIENYYQ